MYSSLQQCKDTLEGIQAIDYYLAAQLCKSLDKTDDDLLFHSILAVSDALRNGHSCLKIDAESDQTRWLNEEEEKAGYIFPAAEKWKQHLLSCDISPQANHPLVYDLERLYLRRYWVFEQELAEIIRKFINQKAEVNLSKQTKIINQLFLQSSSSVNDQETDWQKVAVANALIRQFSIIAGGPGTGKTYTVTKLLAAVQALSADKLKIAMVAPTGKAAQRLNESIQKAKSHLLTQQLVSSDVLQSIPDTASTIHRLLGVRSNSHCFKYNEENPLPFNLLLVDEISMIDLPLMTRLLRAVDSNCQIIMLGDADQLPSVAAGSVLSDLAPTSVSAYSDSTSSLLSQLTGFTIATSKQHCDHVTVLQKSHRFDSSGEIAQLSKLVINGSYQDAWTLLQQDNKQISLHNKLSINSYLDPLIEHYYVPLFNNKLTINQAFESFNQFRFLVITRQGEHGLELINQYIEQYLLKKGLIDRAAEFYPGRPIMVTSNHYQTGLFNGDIGLIWPNQGKLMAAFAQQTSHTDKNSQGAVRWLSISRLPALETVYAMTVHKTQGSEFDHVALIFPSQYLPILSRELLYTGITRAKQSLSIFCDKEVWDATILHKVERYSGLKQRIFKK